jgi:hypothetical protein
VRIATAVKVVKVVRAVKAERPKGAAKAVAKAEADKGALAQEVQGLNATEHLKITLTSVRVIYQWNQGVQGLTTMAIVVNRRQENGPQAAELSTAGAAAEGAAKQLIVVYPYCLDS